MDPVIVSGLISAGLRVYADIADRAARGEVTDADVERMLALLDSKLDLWQAAIDARQAAKA